MFSRLTFTLFCFLAFVTLSFGDFPVLDQDIKVNSDGSYHIPVDSDFVIKFMKRATSFDGVTLAEYKVLRIDPPGHITDESGPITNDFNGYLLFNNPINYTFTFKATALNEEDVTTITFANNFSNGRKNTDFFYKIKVVPAE